MDGLRFHVCGGWGVGGGVSDIDGWVDGWMTCNFTSFSAAFQPYQDDGRGIMKGCVQ